MQIITEAEIYHACKLLCEGIATAAQAGQFKQNKTHYENMIDGAAFCVFSALKTLIYDYPNDDESEAPPSN